MSDVYIVSGCRTPIGSFLGQFQRIPAIKLGSIATIEALKRAQLQPEDVDEVIVGHVLTSGLGQNTARQTSLGANIPQRVPAYAVNMLCGSGLKAVCLGYQAIRNGDSNVIVAAGQESMSRAQHSAFIRGNRLGEVPFVDTLINDGLTDAFDKIHMGLTVEHLAKEYSVSRTAQDAFAAESQNKCQQAIVNGHFDKEIVPVPDVKGNLITKDEFPKANVSVESLSKLSPAFDKNGSVTSGNASGINDGAAALVLCNGSVVTEKKLKPLAKIVAIAQVGLKPIEMGIGPIEAIKQVLNKAKWTKEDVDLFEINEAFAVQSIIVLNELKLDKSIVNVNGGAIALGHPIGASGARVLVTLLHNLERLGKRRGVASLCIGGGMGIAIAVEKV